MPAVSGIWGRRLHTCTTRAGVAAIASRRQATGLVEGVGEAAERLGEAYEHQVAQRMTLELALAEAVLEGGGPRGVVAGERDEAPADVARRRHPKVAAQPARRAAVVGDAHH